MCFILSDIITDLERVADHCSNIAVCILQVQEDSFDTCLLYTSGWMNDTLAYMEKDPIYRSYHHDHLTFGMVYAYTEHFIQARSHDEVVHGKHSLLGKMPAGEGLEPFGDLRAYYGFYIGHPGKKLLFMGQ